MDKQTLSQYGWVVICVLVLAVLIGMSTPFGDLVKASVNSTVSEMSDESENRLVDAFPETVDNLQKKYDFEYYSSFSLAVNDLNNSTRDNADVDKKDAVAGIYTDDKGVDSVVLLKNVTESNLITVSKNSVINLGGNTLEFDTDAGFLKFSSGVTATLDGSTSGSSIKKNIDGKVSYLVRNYGEDLTVNGGTYSISGSYINESSSTTCMAFKQDKTANNITLNNCVISAKNNASGDNCHAYGVQTYGKTATINNCDITAELNGGNIVYGISNHANMTINDSTISASSGDAVVFGVSTFSPLTATNSKFYVDSANNEASNGNYGVALYARRSGPGEELYDIVLNSVTAVGTHTGVSIGPGFNSYITGGRLASCSHGGIYLCNGPIETFVAGENYISGTTLEYIPVEKFESKYDTSTFYTGNRSSFYVGGGSNVYYCNVSVYMDSCNLVSDTYAGTLRGTDGETNNKLYISNSTISSGTQLRLDTGAHHIYIGKGNNFTKDNIYFCNLGGASSYVTETDETYVK